MYVKGKCCQCWCIYLCFYALQSIYTFMNFFMQLLIVMNSTIALWVLMYLGISPDRRHIIVTICIWSWLQLIGYNLNWTIIIFCGKISWHASGGHRLTDIKMKYYWEFSLVPSIYASEVWFLGYGRFLVGYCLIMYTKGRQLSSKLQNHSFSRK